jgi:hypothetical protein
MQSGSRSWARGCKITCSHDKATPAQSFEKEKQRIALK